MTRRALFAMLAATFLPKPLTSSRWGGIQAFWLDEGGTIPVDQEKIRLLERRLYRLDVNSGRYWRVKFNKPTNAFKFFIGDREL